MNYCLAENPEQCCLQQGRGHNLATLERRHLQKMNKTKQSRNRIMTDIPPGRRNTEHHEANLCKGHAKQHMDNRRSF